MSDQVENQNVGFLMTRLIYDDDRDDNDYDIRVVKSDKDS